MPGRGHATGGVAGRGDLTFSCVARRKHAFTVHIPAFCFGRAQELLKRLEDAAMAQRFGTSSVATAAPAAVTAGSSGPVEDHSAQQPTAAWQSQLDQLSQAAAAINRQEAQLDMRCTHYSDLEEAQHVLQEMQHGTLSAHRSSQADTGCA